MFTLRSKDAVRYFSSDILDGYGFVTHAFLTRWGGISEGRFSNLNFSSREGDLVNHVNRNFQIIGSAFHVPQFIWMRQVHGDRVLVVDGKGTEKLEPPQADAVITREGGLGLCIKTADCAPILMMDPRKRVIGAVHAGWRGTSLRIAAKTVEMFQSAFSSKPSDLIAAIGPCIGACCYEVDRVVYDAMPQADREVGFRIKEDGKWMLDLAAANRAHLLEAGLFPGRISTATVCTACREDLFFSHRREGGPTGRQLNFIQLNLKST